MLCSIGKYCSLFFSRERERSHTLSFLLTRFHTSILLQISILNPFLLFFQHSPYMYIYNKHYSVTYQSQQQQLQQSIKKFVNYPIRTITVHVVILIPNSMTMMTTTMTTMMMDSIVAIITTNNAVTGRRNVVGRGIDVSMIVGE